MMDYCMKVILYTEICMMIYSRYAVITVNTARCFFNWEVF